MTDILKEEKKMLRFQVIGCGAAGNKATINIVESEDRKSVGRERVC